MKTELDNEYIPKQHVTGILKSIHKNKLYKGYNRTKHHDTQFTHYKLTFCSFLKILQAILYKAKCGHYSKIFCTFKFVIKNT